MSIDHYIDRKSHLADVFEKMLKKTKKAENTKKINEKEHFQNDIHTSIPDTNHVSREYNINARLSRLFPTT